MRWRRGRRSQNVEDRRGASGGGMRIPGGARRGGIGGVGLIVVVVLALYFGVDPSVLLQGGGQVTQRQTQPAPQNTTRSRADDELADFTSTVLGYTEDSWKVLFKQMDRTYKAPKLVLFSGFVRSACGAAQSAMGPFYCPADQKVYIDLSFYRDMKTKLGAPGDFAQAYVVAHEVGHHVQTLLGISQKVHDLRRSVSKAEANQLSVRMELQADCFSGVWARHADEANKKKTGQALLEAGDLEEGLNAASAIGDDRLQKQSQGYVVPDSFTHGSSAQRVRWFKRGYQTGNVRNCDTFAATQL
ncbi:MAG: KPN_02809 family neutral zinc metallopeptidase [Hyphomicrobiales bacterium]